MNDSPIYDLIGIGIGPFNLGLAALLQDHPDLLTLFLEQQPTFEWHPGMLLPTARMQVPFYADLVTLANPRSKYTYMNYLHVHQRQFRFGVHENIFPLRIEYNRYCQWVADELPNVLFNHRCKDITYNEKKKIYTVVALNRYTQETITVQTNRLVIGIGSQPHIPRQLLPLDHSGIIHSSQYLKQKNKLVSTGDITIIGSGQSAAEIFYHLLQYHTLLNGLHWYTRADRIFPMDYSKFALEMSSPAYIDYFYDLPDDSKQQLLNEQADLYKGINQSLIAAIHDCLYEQEVNNIALKPTIQTSITLQSISAEKDITLQLHNTATKQSFQHNTRAVILATGYQQTFPVFLKNLRNQININGDGEYVLNKNYSVDADNTIFVQNADLHSHGFNSADLGLGPYRNIAIINNILGNKRYMPELGFGFQRF